MPFKGGIEGLRGIAVILVVLAHARVPGLAAGFIGVDVFFVISGFLITGLLTQELRASDRVDYWSFYARRARRLAPALVALVVVVGIAASAWLPRDGLKMQFDSAFWSILWVSNIYFSFWRFDYFGAAAGESLFLHTWSLGVEEQFYLVWPVLVAIAWRRWNASIWWLAGLVVAGFAVSLVIMELDATSAYYLMPARLWQLAAGALAFRVLADNPRLTAAGSDICGALGIAVLILALFVIDSQRAYPGWAALLPTLAAAGMLVAAYNGTGKVDRVLSHPVLRLPGRISYSWYLWHWPLLMFLPAMGLGWPSPSQLVALVLLSFLVAWASYALIEEPFRRSRGPAAPKEVVAVSMLASVVLAVSLHLGVAMMSRGSDPGSARTDLEMRVQAQISVPAIYGIEGCDQWYHSDDLVPCEIPAGTGVGGTMLLIADSVGAQWIPAFEYVARKQERRLVVLTKSSCAIVDEPFYYSRINRRFTECEAWREKAIEYAGHLTPDLVVVGSTGSYEFTPEQWQDGTSRVLDRLSAQGRSVLVLAPTPILPFHAPRCVVARGAGSSGILEAPDCSSPQADAENPGVIRALEEAARNTPGAALLNLNDQVCPKGACRAVLDGRLVYRDEQHLNASFAEFLGPTLDDRIRRFLSSTARH